MYVQEGHGYVLAEKDKKYPPGTVFFNKKAIPEEIEFNVQVVISHGPSNTQVWKNFKVPVKIRDDYLYTTGSYVEWTYEDLKDSEHVSFVPYPVPTLVHPWPDEQRRQRILMDVNGLQQWLTVGIVNTVPKMFYDAYKNSYDTWAESEDFKHNGPKLTPWGKATEEHPDAGWHYDPQAQSFGMDIDGAYLDGNTVYEEVTPGFLRSTEEKIKRIVTFEEKQARDARGRFTKSTGE